MTTEEAVKRLRADPATAGLMRDSYLDEDVAAAARRFAASGEFEEVRRLVGPRLAGAAVLDLGAGTGIASRAFALAGAARVVALEPDPSPVVGQGAIAVSCRDAAAVEVVGGFGESLSFADGTFDVVYARQVLHHSHDLAGLVGECARVIRPGGIFLACREHVVDDAWQLEEFLHAHVVHKLAGGEHAWPLSVYQSAIREAGLELTSTLGPWDTVINAFPAVRSEEERRGYARGLVIAKLGWLGRLLLLVPGVEAAAWRRLDQPTPGRLFTFVARKA
jgi:SAM-dependent methyltransferase